MPSAGLQMCSMKVIISVFNNLSTDQRIEKVCRTLHENGYQVLLIGNSWDGLPSLQRPYRCIRIPLHSRSLKMAYPEFNMKLYREILRNADAETIIVGNDLDTLAANYLASRKLRLPLLYDSHEIYTEMPSVQGRFVQKIWRSLERRIMPHIRYMMTASNSYADWFVKKYAIEKPVVVRNLPHFQGNGSVAGLANTPKIILYQGAINPSRGLDRVIPAVKHLPDAQLWIAGKGPKLEEYTQLVEKLNLTDQVRFLGSLLPEDLRRITAQADVGLSIEENNGLSYYYSLPNKISDYIQARVPVVVSSFPEMKKIVDTYQVGQCIDNHSEKEIAGKISAVLQLGKEYYRPALEQAAAELCWENEESKLLGLYQKIGEENFPHAQKPA